MRPKRLNGPLAIAGGAMLIAFAIADRTLAQEAAAPPATESPAPAADAPAPEKKPAPPVEIPWELKPYVVDIPVTFAADPVLGSRMRAQFVDGLTRRLQDDLGSMWTLTVHEAQGADTMGDGRIDALTPEFAEGHWMTGTADKVFPLFVGRGASGLSFTTREWDRASRLLGPVQTGESPDLRLATGGASQTLRSAFRSLVQIESVDGKSVVFKIRAGELSPPDAAATQLVNGDLVVPFYQLLNRKKEITRVQLIPWTMLRADAIVRARVEATAVSTYPVAVVPSKRRMQALAIEIRPWSSETTLQVVPKSNPGNPVVGVRVEVLDRMPTQKDPVLDRQEYRTDRQGNIVIPAEPTPQVRWAIVTSGKATLARVPFCPGAEKSLTLEIVDDAPRLAVEGEVSLLEADLVELVVQRKILSLRAEGAATAGKPEEARKLFNELKALPDQKSFQQRIDLTRTAGLKEASEQKNPLAESRIKKLCKTLTDVARDHLDPEKYQQAMIDLDEKIREADRGSAKNK